MNKVCGKCKINKSKDMFHKDSSKIDGLTSYCKECKVLYRKNNREKFILAKKRWFQKNKLKVNKISKKKQKIKTINHYIKLKEKKKKD